MLSVCNFAVISKSRKTELEKSLRGHAVRPGTRSSPNHPHKADVPRAAPSIPSLPQNQHQSFPTFNLNLFCYRLSL